MTTDLFIQNLFNALTVGTLYALIAIGYTMDYGTLRFINFAHGDIFMMGAYFIFFTFNFTILPWYMAAVVAIVGAVILGVTIDRVA